jgi:hypothetical protein
LKVFIGDNEPVGNLHNDHIHGRLLVPSVTDPESHALPALGSELLFSPGAAVSQIDELFGLTAELGTGLLLPTKESSKAGPSMEQQSGKDIEGQVPSSDGVGVLEKTWLNLSPHTPK